MNYSLDIPVPGISSAVPEPLRHTLPTSVIRISANGPLLENRRSASTALGRSGCTYFVAYVNPSQEASTDELGGQPDLRLKLPRSICLLLEVDPLSNVASDRLGLSKVGKPKQILDGGKRRVVIVGRGLGHNPARRDDGENQALPIRPPPGPRCHFLRCWPLVQESPHNRPWRPTIGPVKGNFNETVLLIGR